jgi:hypothetical protein
VALQDLRVYGRRLGPADAAALARSQRVADLVAKAAGKRTPAEADELFAWWLANRDGPSKGLLTAVQAVMTGKRLLSATLNERALDAYVTQAREATGPLDRYDLLTNREREVLQLAAQGMSYTDIGERLACPPLRRVRPCSARVDVRGCRGAHRLGDADLRTDPRRTARRDRTSTG